jgi:hypothetical protein
MISISEDEGQAGQLLQVDQSYQETLRFYDKHEL